MTTANAKNTGKPQDKNMTATKFNHNDQEIGKLEIIDGALTFTGNADQSAKVFFNCVVECFLEYKKKIIADAAAAEREACAAICDAYGMPDGTSPTAETLAKAIRARGEKPDLLSMTRSHDAARGEK
jgi:hypothetical protein